MNGLSFFLTSLVFGFLAGFLSINLAWSSSTLHLSDFLEDQSRTGLVLESLEDQITLQRQAKEYSYLNKKRKGQSIKRWIASCAKPLLASPNPFCAFILDLERDKIKAKKNSRLAKKIGIKKLIRQLKLGEISELASRSARELGDALKRIKKLKQIESVIRYALADEKCQSSALFLALGLRLEAEFPYDEFKSLATLLYQQSQKCAPDVNSVQSVYRLGLLQIWDQKYKEALDTLSSAPEALLEPSYRMRIGYWKFFCADQLKDLIKKDQLQKWLLKEYPLSLHNLLANTWVREDSPQVLKGLDPEVRFRSQKDEGLNDLARAVEALMAEKEMGLTARLLLSSLSRIQLSQEVPFQLYWVVLLNRVGERPAGFELMAKLFRENPQLISKEALAVMYPLRESSVISEWMGFLDPYLVLSVIRQESAFNQRARSSAGALGLMQLRPSTARELERVSRNQLWKPQVNIRLGVKYLKKLVSSFDGDVELALAAYNAGPNRIKQWLKRYPISNRLLFLDLLPLKETREYVSSIARNYYWYSKLYTHAFVPLSEKTKRLIQSPLLLQNEPLASRVPLSSK